MTGQYAGAHDGGLVHQLFMDANGNVDEFVQLGGSRTIAIGTLLAILAAVANGSFAVLAKSRTVRSARVDPYVFTFWACVGIFISSLLLVVRAKFVWTWWALLSALFFVLSIVNAFRAVRLIGVSVGTGVWAGTAVVVSFLAGLFFDPRAGVHHVVVAIVAILIILGGIAGLGWSGHLGRIATGQEERLESLLSTQRGALDVEGAFSSGVISAIVAGVFGGLIMLPLTWSPHKAQGLHYVPPFGICVLILAPFVTTLPYLVVSREWPDFHWDVASIPGIVSGIIWNVGNILSVCAIMYLGYPVAYPIFQCGVFVAGLWGMLLFDEIRNDSAAKFWGSGLVIIVGIALLSYASA